MHSYNNKPDASCSIIIDPYLMAYICMYGTFYLYFFVVDIHCRAQQKSVIIGIIIRRFILFWVWNKTPMHCFLLFLELMFLILPKMLCALAFFMLAVTSRGLFFLKTLGATFVL